MKVNYTVFAQAYGQGNYNSSTYNGATTTPGGDTGTGTTSPAPTPTSTILTNTGFDILFAVTIACVIIFAALVIRFWRRPPKTTVVSTDISDRSTKK